MAASFFFLMDIIILVKASPLSDGPWGPTNPVADPDAVILVDGPQGSQVRFTVLTDRMIRIERGPGEDRKTIAVINRKLPVPNFFAQTQSDEGILKLQTGCLTLTYVIGTTFTAETLQVSGSMYCNLQEQEILHDTEKYSEWTYRYGDDDPANLRGTIRTLDRLRNESLDCSQQDSEAHCEWGLISRSGYAVVNDTLNFVLNNEDWWDGPNKNDEDLYILGHGHDYKSALGDYRLIGGYIPLLPRYALGVWFSRWYDYTSAEAAEVVRHYEEHTLPLDVFVLDMNWHTKNDWTGYSWDKRLFQHPKDAVAYMKHRGLAVTLNLHDADGVNPWEEQYSDMCSAIGCSEGRRIYFSIVNSTISYALEDIVLKPLEDDGVDFWWIDWQQGEKGRGGAAGGKQNPTIWTAHIRSTNTNRRRQQYPQLKTMKRSMVLARWGGLGAHRFPVSFSGDVNGLSWDNLAYQPYFSMTATNVGALWSHDLEGPSLDPELYTRWLQWGAVSGILRSHDRGGSAGDCANKDPPSCSIVVPWNVPPNYAQANYEALRLRGSMIPYLYTAAYNAHKTGKWFTTPLYYEWPELEAAYQTASPRPDPEAGCASQYLLGDDMWVAPVVSRANTTDDLVEMKVWVPPGKWIGVRGGRVLNGAEDGSTYSSLLVDLTEIPIFSRAGAIIPSIPVIPGTTVGLAMKPYYDLIWTVYLADGAPRSGRGILYEDDGTTTNYHVNSSFAKTTAYYNISEEKGFGAISTTQQSKRRIRAIGFSQNGGPPESMTTRTLNFTVSTSGSFHRQFSRATTIRLVNTLPPFSVLADNAEVPFSRFGGIGTWSFDIKDSAVIIELSESDVSQGIHVVIELPPKERAICLDGLGFQISRAIKAKAALDEIRATPGSRTGEDKKSGGLLLAASSGSALEYLAGLSSLSAFKDVVQAYKSHLKTALDEVQQLDTLIDRTLRKEHPDTTSSHYEKLNPFNRFSRAIALLKDAIRS